MTLALQLASRYFGLQGNGQMQTAQLQVGSSLHSAQQLLTKSIGEWNPGEQAIIDLNKQASRLETMGVVAGEYSKALIRRNRAISGYVRTLANHHTQAARQSLDNAKMQDQHLKGMIPLSLQMGGAVASHEGRQQAFSQSRLNF